MKFEIQDIDNEVHPDPIFGHGAQAYVRKDDPGVIDSATHLPIGDNLPIKFRFTTGTFIIVPPKNIGDIVDPYEDNRIPNFKVNP